MKEIAAGVWLHEATAEGFPTAAVVTLTAGIALVVDTLTGPADMAPVLTLLRQRAGSRRVVVVNTHHHWDHVYGNAAFPEAEIVGHRLCRELLLARPAEEEPPPPAEGVRLPTLTFDGHLTWHQDDEVIELVHAPGHSPDSIAVFLRRRRMLLAGDALKWPLPSYAAGTHVATWLATIGRLRRLDPAVIVPGHGPVMDAGLLDANERYLRALSAAVAGARQRGRAPSTTAG